MVRQIRRRVLQSPSTRSHVRPVFLVQKASKNEVHKSKRMQFNAACSDMSCTRLTVTVSMFPLLSSQWSSQNVSRETSIASLCFGRVHYCQCDSYGCASLDSERERSHVMGTARFLLRSRLLALVHDTYFQCCFWQFSFRSHFAGSSRITLRVSILIRKKSGCAYV